MGDTVSFDVPAGVASITIVEQVVSAPAHAAFASGTNVPNTAVPLRITDPRGAIVYDVFHVATDPTTAPLYFPPTSAAAGAGTVTIPNTTAALDLVSAGLPQGTWTVVVSDLAYACSLTHECAAAESQVSSYAMTVILKPGSTPGDIPSTGTLDIAFNLTAAGLDPPLSAATAATDTDVQRLSGALRALLGQAGVTLGTVTYRDVPTEFAARIASGVDGDDLTACGELQQLFATAPAGRQVNVFMVSNVISTNGTPGTITLGQDGTIPGPATLSPTIQSGVVATAADLRVRREACQSTVAPGDGGCGADRVAYIIAHEIGHFLGLYHVTNGEGTAFDPLGDTPTCACQSCSSNAASCADPVSPSIIGVRDCLAGGACSGGDNLMFWSVGQGSVGVLTSEQQRVMRANPAIY